VIPLALFLLGCLAVYVGSVQAAFSELMRLSLRLMAERTDRRDVLARYLDDPILLFFPARLLLGLTFSISAVLFAVLIGTATARHDALLLLVVAGFILAVEHLVPVLIARQNPERVLEILLPSFKVLTAFLQPIARALVRLMHERRDRPSGVVQDGADAAEDAAEPPAADEPTPVIDREERRLLRSVVEFGETLVREVMTPRPDIVALKGDATLDELRALFREQEYSRFPVYRENLDNIVGVIVVKDLIRLGGTGGAQRPISALMRPAYFVPETKLVAELLKEFQSRQVQLAIVVDEYGGTAGLVTMEDLLEEIVGEIRDEYDVEFEPVIDEGNGAFVFSAKLNIDEVADRLGVRIEPEGFETVGGFVLTHVGRVPAVGERFEIGELVVEVMDAERRRIHKVRVWRRPETTEEQEA
jgi:CBS domain containing-hemolysin-like protein